MIHKNKSRLYAVNLYVDIFMFLGNLLTSLKIKKDLVVLVVAKALEEEIICPIQFV